MNRREFLTGTAILTLSQLMAGCQTKSGLKVLPLTKSVPAQLLSAFSNQIKSATVLEFTPKSQLAELFKVLQVWQQEKVKKDADPERIADLVMLGDYWLGKAIEQKLIQPLDPTKLKSWSNLGARWQNLVTRNDQGKIDKNGKIWAAPYRWGSTVIIYRVDKFKELGWVPSDWSDLWREELRGRISLPDQAREVIGLTLKKLGHSYNTAEIDKIANLKSELNRLNSLVKFYSSQTYLQPLITGDTWLAVGWSSDIALTQQSESPIASIIPRSGTALFADLWVEPAGKNTNKYTPQWIDFCWQPEVAKTVSLISQIASPIFTEMNPQELPLDLQQNSLIMTDKNLWNQSEFITPLSAEVTEKYRQIWQEMRYNIPQQNKIK